MDIEARSDCRGGYDGMHLIYEAVKKACADAGGEQLVEAMMGM